MELVVLFLDEIFGEGVKIQKISGVNTDILSIYQIGAWFASSHEALILNIVNY